MFFFLCCIVIYSSLNSFFIYLRGNKKIRPSELGVFPPAREPDNLERARFDL